MWRVHQPLRWTFLGKIDILYFTLAVSSPSTFSGLVKPTTSLWTWLPYSARQQETTAAESITLCLRGPSASIMPRKTKSIPSLISLFRLLTGFWKKEILTEQKLRNNESNSCNEIAKNNAMKQNKNILRDFSSEYGLAHLRGDATGSIRWKTLLWNLRIAGESEVGAILIDARHFGGWGLWFNTSEKCVL